MHKPEGARILTSAKKRTHGQVWRRTLIDKIMGLTPTTLRLTASSNSFP